MQSIDGVGPFECSHWVLEPHSIEKQIGFGPYSLRTSADAFNPTKHLSGGSSIHELMGLFARKTMTLPGPRFGVVNGYPLTSKEL